MLFRSLAASAPRRERVEDFGPSVLDGEAARGPPVSRILSERRFEKDVGSSAASGSKRVGVEPARGPLASTASKIGELAKGPPASAASKIVELAKGPPTYVASSSRGPPASAASKIVELAKGPPTSAASGPRGQLASIKRSGEEAAAKVSRIVEVPRRKEASIIVEIPPPPSSDEEVGVEIPPPSSDEEVEVEPARGPPTSAASNLRGPPAPIKRSREGATAVSAPDKASAVSSSTFKRVEPPPDEEEAGPSASRVKPLRREASSNPNPIKKLVSEPVSATADFDPAVYADISRQEDAEQFLSKHNAGKLFEYNIASGSFYFRDRTISKYGLSVPSVLAELSTRNLYSDESLYKDMTESTATQFFRKHPRAAELFMYNDDSGSFYFKDRKISKYGLNIFSVIAELKARNML